MNEYLDNLKKIKELEQRNSDLVLKNNTRLENYLFTPHISVSGVDDLQTDVNLTYVFYIPAQDNSIYFVKLEISCVVEEHKRGDILTYIRTNKLDLNEKSKFLFCNLDDFIQTDTLERAIKDLFTGHHEINDSTISQDTACSLFPDFILEMNQQYMKPQLKQELLSHKVHYAHDIEDKAQELINSFVCSIYARKSVYNQISDSVIQSVLHMLEPHEKKYRASQLEKILPSKEKSKTHKI